MHLVLKLKYVSVILALWLSSKWVTIKKWDAEEAKLKIYKAPEIRGTEGENELNDNIGFI